MSSSTWMPGRRDLEDYWKSQAASKLRLSADQIFWKWFVPGIHGESGMSWGTAPATRSYISGGWLRLDTAANAGAVSQLDAAPVIAAVRGKPVVAGAGTKFWCAARAKLPTGAGAGSIQGVGLLSGAGAELIFGNRGATDTANFHLYGPTGSVIVGPALDTNAHTVEFWREDGATTNWLMDNVLRTGNPRPTNDADLGAFVTDSAAVSRQMDLAWMGIACVAP